jgi:hypothetical protein
MLLRLTPYTSLYGARSTRAIPLCRIDVVWPSSQEMVTSLQVVLTIVPRSVVVAPQQTRSSGLRSLDWAPVIVQTAPMSLRQMEQLFVSACEGSRFLDSARVPETGSLRRIALPHFLFGMFRSYDYSSVPQSQRKHTKAWRARISSSLESLPVIR